ncbi:MAG: hypothetical protein QM820_52220 [Minicystis sp.]
MTTTNLRMRMLTTVMAALTALGGLAIARPAHAHPHCDPPSSAPPAPTFEWVGQPRFSGWNAPLVFDLSPYMPLLGLGNTLVNYYAEGAPAPGGVTWSRFDPRSPFYQAWVGTYLAGNLPAGVTAEWSGCHGPQDTGDVQATAAHVVALTIADQNIWNLAYGDASFATALASPTCVRELHGNQRILDRPTFEVSWDLDAKSDVGDAAPAFPWYPAWESVSDDVDPYAPVVLHATASFTVSGGVLVVSYRASTTWWTRDGEEHETPAWAVEQQRAMLRRVTFE